MLARGTPKDREEARDFAPQVQLAVSAALDRFRERKEPPDFWTLVSYLQLALIRGEWDKVSDSIPDVIANSGGQQNIETTLQDLQRLSATWEQASEIGGGDRQRLKDTIEVFKKALENPAALNPLSENSISYVSVLKFADMEGAFATDPFNLSEELTKSGIGTDLATLSKQNQVNIMSFHEFLAKGKAGFSPGAVLLAPTGPYRSVMQAIAEGTGLTPWWKAYETMGLGKPEHAPEFIERVAHEGQDVYLLVPRDFRGRIHQDSYTLQEFELIVKNFTKLGRKVHFVFGFENTFPLDYENRLSEEDVHRNYRDNVMRLFLEKFQAWLVELGDKVKHYSFANVFTQSMYPKIYDQVLGQLPAYQALEEMHSRYMPAAGLILDLGGGTGLLAKFLMELHPSRHVLIVDNSQAMTGMALAKGLSVVPNSITSLPFASGSVDGAVCNNVAYLLTKSELDLALSETFRVLRPNGRLSIASMLKTTPEIHQAFLRQVVEDVRRLEASGKIPLGSAKFFFSANQNLLSRSPTLYTREEIAQMAMSHGFKVVVPNGSTYAGAGFFLVFEKP
jgi:ubiquinone/menaquinone biosynthesis C-methylase UbiE